MTNKQKDYNVDIKFFNSSAVAKVALDADSAVDAIWPTVDYVKTLYPEADFNFAEVTVRRNITKKVKIFMLTTYQGEIMAKEIDND
jgi:hypothetical protein